MEEGLTNCNNNVIFMNIRLVIEITNLEDYKETKFREYQCLISKLMYLTCGIRLDITFVVDQLNKHNANPKKVHLRTAKRVVKYLKGTVQMGLIFGEVNATGRLPQDLPLYGLVRYVDSNFTKNPEDHKAIIGYCFFLNSAVVSWSSKK